REPYRIEGKKTLGLELALQFGWSLPDAIIYPAGGGTGLIGMHLAFAQLLQAGWLTGTPPRFFAVQSTGCAPLVKAMDLGTDHCDPWPEPWTVASGLRVPAPLGDRLMLRALRESRGGALAIDDAELTATADEVARREGVSVAPEGGAALAAAHRLREQGVLSPDDKVVVFNTGAGWLYQ
ncbi:MAG: pyridoxal-phosphate dependent enzyme, partial [Gemmatimonadales bacterium]